MRTQHQRIPVPSPVFKYTPADSTTPMYLRRKLDAIRRSLNQPIPKR